LTENEAHPRGGAFFSRDLASFIIFFLALFRPKTAVFICRRRFYPFYTSTAAPTLRRFLPFPDRRRHSPSPFSARRFLPLKPPRITVFSPLAAPRHHFFTRFLHPFPRPRLDILRQNLKKRKDKENEHKASLTAHRKEKRHRHVPRRRATGEKAAAHRQARVHRRQRRKSSERRKRRIQQRKNRAMGKRKI
jgi:hypothetical protein